MRLGSGWRELRSVLKRKGHLLSVSDKPALSASGGERTIFGWLSDDAFAPIPAVREATTEPLRSPRRIRFGADECPAAQWRRLHECGFIRPNLYRFQEACPKRNRFTAKLQFA
jgi:hypothetical protein